MTSGLEWVQCSGCSAHKQTTRNFWRHLFLTGKKQTESSRTFCPTGWRQDPTPTNKYIPITIDGAVHSALHTKVTSRSFAIFSRRARLLSFILPVAAVSNCSVRLWINQIRQTLPQNYNCIQARNGLGNIRYNHLEQIKLTRRWPSQTLTQTTGFHSVAVETKWIR